MASRNAPYREYKETFDMCMEDYLYNMHFLDYHRAYVEAQEEHAELNEKIKEVRAQRRKINSDLREFWDKKNREWREVVKNHRKGLRTTAEEGVWSHPEHAECNQVRERSGLRVEHEDSEADVQHDEGGC